MRGEGTYRTSAADFPHFFGRNLEFARLGLLGSEYLPVFGDTRGSVENRQVLSPATQRFTADGNEKRKGAYYQAPRVPGEPSVT
jgi:hypothetical protein